MLRTEICPGRKNQRTEKCPDVELTVFCIISMLLMFTVPCVWFICVHCMDNIVIWLKGSILAYNNNKINVKLEKNVCDYLYFKVIFTKK